VVLLTGGSRGLGLELARVLAHRGARLALLARDDEELARAREEIRPLGAEVETFACDVRFQDQVQRVVREVIQRFGRVDVLINNAGHSSHARSIRWVGRKEWDSVMAVNVNAVYVLTQAVLPGMIQRKRGTIVTVGSLAALRAGLIGGAPYGAAKAAVRNLMQHIHNTLRNEGIRATIIMPAEVDTPILNNRPLPPDAAARATMAQPEDVAEAIMLCVTLPERTVIEELVVSPTRTRDQSRDIEVARNLGAPPGVK